MTREAGHTRRIWTAPLLIAGAMVVALVGALLADGVWDWLAAALLFGVLAYAVTLGLRPAGARTRRSR